MQGASFLVTEKKRQGERKVKKQAWSLFRAGQKIKIRVAMDFLLRGCETPRQA